MSSLFSQTLREAPSDASTQGYALLVRAGFIRQLASGIFTMMPLAKRAVDKISTIIRAEMDAIGGQEISMPVVHPAELWKESGRWFRIDAELSRFKDRNEHDMVLGMTHEEVVGDLARKEIRSYRQLPCLVYQLQTKWRDDPRPRAGLIRVREFVMKDSYSLDRDWEGLETQYRAHYQAYFNIFRRCGLPVISVAADVGMMGGKLAHEYMYLTPVGEDTLLLCDSCGYSANRQMANFRKGEGASHGEPPRPVEEVHTPGTKTIEDLAKFLKIDASQTAKAVFFVASVPKSAEKSDGAAAAPAYEDRFVLALIRGDLELNETKLLNVIGARALRPARDEEIRAVGVVPGFGSPIGANGAFVVADDSVRDAPNLVAGANREDYHLRNSNCGRDYQPEIIADVAAAREGDACPKCGSAMRTSRGVEVGNIFQLGTRYSDSFGVTFLDQDGAQKPVIMGSYGIGVGRLLACASEEHNDADGLAWPVTIAPYQVHLVGIADGDAETEKQIGAQYAAMVEAGIEVLWDDREERPGVKFKDADLMGMPIRVTVSRRSLEKGGAEMKLRDPNEDRSVVIVPLSEIVTRVRSEIARLTATIQKTVVEEAYR